MEEEVIYMYKEGRRRRRRIDEMGRGEVEGMKECDGMGSLEEERKRKRE